MLKHGGSDIYKVNNLVEDFSVTTNFLGPSKVGLEFVSKSLDKINHYPSEDKNFFKEGLDFLKVQSENVLWGNGASELIDLVIRVWTKKNSYSTYGKFPKVQYMEYERCCLNNGLFLHTETKPYILLIVNPTNPTGEYNKKDAIKQQIDNVKNNGLVIIDESMMFWIGNNWHSNSFLSEAQYINQLKKNNNIDVVLIQSWTKIFSCTGIRFGSLVSFNTSLILELEKYKTPWSVNVLSYQYLKGCLSDEQYLKETWDKTPILREKIKNQILNLFPFSTVYGEPFLSWLWVDFKSELIAQTIYSTSLEYGIPVRHGKIGYNHPTFIRFAVRNEDSNQVLFDMLANIKKVVVKKPAYYFNIPDELVYGVVKMNLSNIKSHEEHICERKLKLVEYLNSNDYFILPSIIVDCESLVVLDGHHRLNILKEKGKQEEYMLLVNYSHSSIIPHEFNKITKNQIIEAGLSGKLLAPKSSKHLFYDNDGNKHPLISLSVIVG